MTTWRNFSKFATLICVFIIILILVFQWKKKVKIYNVDCNVEACVRVCNSSTLMEEDIKTSDYSQKLSENFNIVIGRPECEMYEDDDIWSFQSVNI